MPEVRLRFRCYRCNQLMGATLKRVGTTISCPRCKAELKVPAPDEQSPAEGAGEPAVTSQAEGPALPSFMEEIAAAIPEDLISLRPEDIRAEGSFADLVVDTQAPPAPSVTIQPEPPLPTKPLPEPVPIVPEPAAGAATPTPAAPSIAPAAPAPPRIEVVPGSILPPIQIEPTRIRPSEREVRNIQEVVLQPATVLAWSLLVLMAVPMAFIAGLMIGHFVWK